MQQQQQQEIVGCMCAFWGPISIETFIGTLSVYMFLSTNLMVIESFSTLAVYNLTNQDGFGVILYVAVFFLPSFVHLRHHLDQIHKWIRQSIKR